LIGRKLGPYSATHFLAMELQQAFRADVEVGDLRALDPPDHELG